MADPVTATWVMVGSSIASSIAQGMSAEQQLKAQQKAMDSELAYLAQQREYLNESRDEELDLFRRETKDLLGLQTVGFAKSGVELSGSVLNVLNTTELDAKEEEERIYRQYARARTLSELESAGVRAQKHEISRQRDMVFWTSLLGGASGATTSYYRGRQLTRKPSKASKEIT